MKYVTTWNFNTEPARSVGICVFYFHFYILLSLLLGFSFLVVIFLCCFFILLYFLPPAHFHGLHSLVLPQPLTPVPCCHFAQVFSVSQSSSHLLSFMPCPDPQFWRQLPPLFFFTKPFRFVIPLPSQSAFLGPTLLKLWQEVKSWNKKIVQVFYYIGVYVHLVCLIMFEVWTRKQTQLQVESVETTTSDYNIE